MQLVDNFVVQIIVLILLGFTGFAAGKTRYIPESSGVVLSQIVIKLTAPILIVTTMTNQSFTRSDIKNGIFIYILGIVFLLFSYIIGGFTCKRLKLEGSTGNVYKMHSMFGNVLFLAFPLINSLYGSKGVVYSMFFNLANDTILWTLGIYLVNRHNTSQWRDNLKRLVNSNTIAFGIGIVSILVGFQNFTHRFHYIGDAYNFIYNTFNPLGQTTIYLSMLFIGLILSEVKISAFSDIIKRYPIFILSFFKMLFVPFIALLVLSVLGGFIEPFAGNIIIMQIAMPCATIVAALAAQYESDYRFATETVFISTLLGLITLPLMVYILKLFGYYCGV